MTALDHTMTRIRPVSNWPEEDRTRWFASCQAGPSDFLKSLETAALLEPKTEKSAASYEETTRLNLIDAWGQYLEYLAQSETQALSGSIKLRADLDQIFGYLKELERLGRAPQTIGARANSIAMFLSVTCPEVDTADLRALAARMKRGAPTVSKSGRIVAPVVLIGLGERLMQHAWNQTVDETPTKDAATTFRDGLLIALLAQRPIRRQNLADLEIGSSFTCQAGQYEIHLTAEQVKTDYPIDVPCPKALTTPIEHYLAIFRPVLLGKDSCQHLWVSSGTGRRLTAIGIYQAIRRRTRDALGFPVNPHLFRDCAATFMYLQSPELAWMIAGLLGHGNLVTGKKYYIQAQSKAGHEQYQGLIAAIRDDKPMATTVSTASQDLGDYI
ncbi:MAG: hypothetical protein ACMVO3_11360 [Thalassobaculum sp.]|jgi:site-specific recombinase XerC